jgi:hypothetical protein
VKKAVVAIVATELQAERLSARLHDAGFRGAHISLLLPDVRGIASRGRAFADTGGGALLRGTLGLLVGVDAVRIPGLGLFIAAGPIMTTLGSAAVFGLVSALVDMGIPEFEARIYEGKIRAGNVFISVHTESAAAQTLALELFKTSGAHAISMQSEMTIPTAPRISVA